MRERVTATLRRIVATFGAFTPGQKAVTIFAVIALAVGGYFFSTWASTPTYAPLFSNLSSTDASAIVDKLAADGTQYELANSGGTIMVPQDQVYALRLKMSGAGLPANTDSAAGYSLLDKQSTMTSDAMQQKNMQRALEGELANTIKSIDGVQSASVHLAIPTKDVFTEDTAKPTASVLIGTSATKKLSTQQVQAVTHLVASSVEGMDAANVSIVGSDGKLLSDTSDGTGSGDTRTQQTQTFEQRMNASLEAMLTQVVGEGHASVKVTADLDYDQTETKTQKYVAEPSAPALAESKKVETYGTGGTGSTGTGVLGPDNIQVPTAAASAGTGGYQNYSETKNNAVGMVTETRKAAPGAVRKLSVAVLLDSKAAAGANEAQLQQLVSSAVGLDATRGDSIAVTALPFSTSAADQTKSELDASAKADQQARLYSYIKNGAIAGGVALLLVIAMFRGRRRNRKLRKLIKAEVATDPTQSAIDAASTTAIEANGGEGVLALEAKPSEADGLAAEREARQREIAELVEKQPDEVAQLLRGWLADRRG
jgi:flagellar M-ring protein FliF